MSVEIFYPINVVEKAAGGGGSLVEISPGITEIAPRWIVYVKPVRPFGNVIPGSTAEHEAFHTVAAILTGDEVVDASRIPGPGFKGRTRLSRFNAIAFVAAYARGCDGTGHDLWVLNFMGHDTNSSAGAARSVLSGHDEEIYAVASLIEERGAISGYEAEEVMDRVRNPEMDIRIINPLGREGHFQVKTRQGGGIYLNKAA